MNRSRFGIALAMVAFALLSYYGTREKNPVTGETQHVGLSQDQEVVLGLQSAPEMADQFGGLDPDPSVQAEGQELAEAIHRVVNDRFSSHQRTVFLALLMRDATPADLASRMGLNANAIYQIAFRARHCLHSQLRANGLLD